MMRLRLRQAEHARLRVAGLRARRHRADLDEAEAERGQRVDVFAVLVEPGGQADGVGKVKPHHRDRVRLERTGEQAGNAGAVEKIDAGHTQTVGEFGV